ncbi:UDP-N-acetylglucosamine 2-epimerase (non-hydrolyzing) [soil metagenome]
MNLTIIAGARPNFMKIAPLIHEILRVQKNGSNISYSLVHTGQHYDPKLSQTFFNELNIPAPDVNLEVGSGTQAEQTGNIMIRFEKYLMENPSDLLIVVGDVTSTMACSIVAKKLNTEVAHIEAGIRSFDLTMPEEINRMVTDSITDHFFTTSEVANQNLRKAGVPTERIYFVGNIMIDTLLKNKDLFKKPEMFDENDLKEGKYLVMTLHRPSNVDEPDKLKNLLNEIVSNSQDLPLVFPVHPRTKVTLEQIKFAHPQVILTQPLSYLEFNYMVKNAKAVITDSGGIQEETTVMGIPCITMRNNTERPETVTVGSNVMVGDNMDLLKKELKNLFEGKWKKSNIPELWDGKTAKRIVEILLKLK